MQKKRIIMYSKRPVDPSSNSLGLVRHFGQDVTGHPCIKWLNCVADPRVEPEMSLMNDKNNGVRENSYYKMLQVPFDQMISPVSANTSFQLTIFNDGLPSEGPQEASMW